MKLQIKNIRKEDWSIWNDFVKESGITYTIAHNPAIGEILANQEGWTNKNVVLMRDDKVAAAFPYMRKDNQLISMPYFSYGGILTPIDEIKLSEMLLDMVFHYEDELVKDQKLRNVELRLFRRSLPFIRNNKVSTFVKLKDNSSDQFESFSSELKRKLFKSNASEYKTIEGGMEMIPEFYNLYEKSLRGKHHITITEAFLRNLLLNYENGEARIFMTYHKNKAVGASVFLSYMGTSEACWTAILDETKYRYASYSLHWTMMKKAIDVKAEKFSLGLSEFGSLNHLHRKQWGGNDYVLYWNFMFDPGKLEEDYSGFGRFFFKTLPVLLTKGISPILNKIVY